MALSRKLKRLWRSRRRARQGENKPARPFSPARIFLYLNLAVIAIIFLLSLRPNAFQKKIGPSDIAYYNGRTLTVTGRICAEADMDIKSLKLTLCVSGQTQGRILLTTPLYPPYNYGDFISATGLLQAPPTFPGFDYAQYLARYNIYSVMYAPKTTLISGHLSLFQKAFRALMEFKWRLKIIMDSALPEPEAGLAAALLLGYNHTVDKSDLLIFSRVGISHMIAISGSHITVLSAMIINFLLVLGLNRRRALWGVFIFLFIYPLMTGLAASALRSAIMAALAFLAIYHNRTSSLINALIFSAAIMLLFNPLLLSVDIGFQLSFVAILGIIYIYPIGDSIVKNYLAKKHWRTRTKKMVKTLLETINLTLVSQLVILPISLISFQQLSLIAPITNLLILWTFPTLLASLIIGIFAAALLPAFKVFLFFPASLLLKFVFGVSALLAKPAWAALVVTNFTWRWGALYYLLLGGVVWALRTRIDKR